LAEVFLLAVSQPMVSIIMDSKNQATADGAASEALRSIHIL
jgi:hypothetical protein